MMTDVYWIGDGNETRIGIVPRPRGGDWLEDDIRRLKRAGVDFLVSMLTREEEVELGLELEGDAAAQANMRFRRFPIVDRATPTDFAAFQQFTLEVADAMEAGASVGVHCRGCIGRATILSAAVLIQRGWAPDGALIAIETARGCSVPDTLEQKRWIEQFMPVTGD